MTTITVTSQAELVAALKTAQGGDTILLADGHYGDIDLKNDYTSTVTIKAENPLGAQFTRLGLVGATNITIDGLQLETGLAVKDGSKDIGVLNCDIDGNFYTRNVNGLTVDGVDVSGGRWGLLLNSVQNFSITNSFIHEVTEDLMRITGNSYNGVIENNIIGDTKAPKPLHPDVIQVFHANGYVPHDITIRGNLLYDLPDEGMVAAQGIFLGDAGRGEGNQGFENFIIEGNLISTAAKNTIFVNSGKDTVVIENNTLMPRGGGGNIRLVGKDWDDGGPVIEGNIVNTIILETKAIDHPGNNYVYGKHGSGDDVATLFAGVDPSQWESYLPVAGSAIDFGSGYGAAERLLALLKEFAAIEESGTANDDQTPLPVDDAPALEPDTTDDTDTDTLPDQAETPAVVVKPTIVYDHDKVVQLRGQYGHYVEVGHQDAMAIDEGSISLTFNADVTGWKRALISKDSSGTGDAISAWIDNGTLIVRFQDGENTVSFTKEGIKTHTDYDLLITFDEEKVAVWLDDTLLGEAAMDVDMSNSSDSLLIGAFNGKSSIGTTNNVQYFFDGTITDVMIYDTALTPAELAALDSEVHAETLSDIGLGLQSGLHL